MIIVGEIEIQPRALKSPIELMIAWVKVVKLNPLCKQLSLNVVSKWYGVISSLVLQLIDIVICHVLI